MLGICAICRKEGDLQRSHFLPAGFFKAVVQGHAPHDDAPVMMDITKGTAVQSNLQVRKHLLCIPCEQRFSSSGEAHVIANCHRKDGEFKLRDRLRITPPSTTSSGRSVYHGHELPSEIDAGAYSYFVLSVLWRASVTNWPGATGVRQGCLGPKYEEAIRQFLLGDAGFPMNVSVNIYVNFDADPLVFLAFPTHGPSTLLGHKVHQHSLHVPGIRFIVLIGGNVGRIEIDNVNARPGSPTFFEWHPSRTEFHRKLIQDTKGLTSKGKLARDIP